MITPSMLDDNMEVAKLKFSIKCLCSSKLAGFLTKWDLELTKPEKIMTYVEPAVADEVMEN